MGAATSGGWPFSTTTKPFLQRTCDGPLTNAREKMLGVYSFGHLQETQQTLPKEVGGTAAAAASRAPARPPSTYGFPAAPSQSGAKPEKSTTTQSQNRDIQTLWERNEPDRAARHVYYRPQSARPNARQTGPELEYLAPVPGTKDPEARAATTTIKACTRPRWRRLRTRVQLANATRKEAAHNKTASHHSNVRLQWE
eukprot:CAMPEP_0114274312 /NCGR_PEP_ID=MMETSP0058-20121206/29670_1 /TAXON_ID=36894 /ORGANISM="Pyramimonas parkeae, CCMP726" /LENGTH=196 /DNA_ID=CAMNT_0001394039 /DNA_START=240 /DNA_END=831 /DNA_ORIENTATION=-